jgi:hypothetical protein
MIVDTGTHIHGQVKHDFTVPRTNHGTYTGNGSQNRAISHGLGTTPSCVIISNLDDPGNANCFYSGGAVFQIYGGGAGLFIIGNVTAWDDTNFYVGTTAAGGISNVNAYSFLWAAFS